MAAGIAVLLPARLALADDAQALDQAKNPFDNGNYEEAHGRLSELLDPKLPTCDSVPIAAKCRLTSPDLIERARALDAATLLALKRDTAADRLIGDLLKANPNYVPSPAMFPQEVIDHFNAVRSALEPELRAILEQRAHEVEAKRLAAQKAREDEEKWIEEVHKLAAKERRSEPNSRWLALIPFGIGQIQNGDLRAGLAFAIPEAIAGSLSLASVAVVNGYASIKLPPYADVSVVNKPIANWTIVNRVSFSVWGALTLAGIVHAQVTFVPARITYHDRPVPPRPKLVPVAVPVPKGALLGVGGTF